MKINYICRLIINTKRKNTRDDVVEKFIKKFFSDIAFFDFVIMEYWKDTNKSLCEFSFSIENDSNAESLKSCMLLLARMSNNWDITFDDALSSNLYIGSSICQKTKLLGIDWINIEKTS